MTAPTTKSQLAPDDFVDSQGRVVLMTGVWSHQLGARGARKFVEHGGNSRSYFGADSLEPMTDAGGERISTGIADRSSSRPARVEARRGQAGGDARALTG